MRGSWREAILVNVARGGIVGEQALYEHLRSHPGFGAGLDVWWQEPARGTPFRAGHPFVELPNVIGSPHNSGTVAGVLQGGGPDGRGERAAAPAR